MGCCSSTDGPGLPSDTEAVPDRGTRTKRHQNMNSVDSDSEAGTDYGGRRNTLVSFGKPKEVPPHQDESYIDVTPTHSVEIQDHIPFGASPVHTSQDAGRSPSFGVASLAMYNTDHYVSVYAQQQE